MVNATTPSSPTSYDAIVTSIRANAESDQTVKTYVGAMNAVQRVAGNQSLGRALTSTYVATYRGLVHASSDLKPGTIKTRITGIMGAFKLCPALAEEDANGSAREFWSGHHRAKLADVRAAASSNLATPEQVKNMVTLPQILKAARSLTHATLKQSQDKVLLMIAALVPAKRADWARLRIVKSLAAVEDTENALLVKPGEMKLVLNMYKTCRTYGRHVEDIDGEAAETIRASLAAHPRTHLFVSPARANGMSNDAFATYLSGAFDRHMRKHVTVDLLRHIWVTQSVDPRKMTVKEIDELARKMLHGADTQRLYFLVSP
jgi:hypothetical protein